MKPHPRMYLQQYTYYISKDRLQKGLLLDFFTQKKCTKPYFTFTEDQTGNYNVTSLSLYGAEYIKWSLERYEYKSYSNVSELKFEVLIAKYGSEILGVGRTDGDILFENGLIQLVCRKSCVGIVDTYIKTLLQFEGEKDFSIKTSDLEKTKELCKELVEDGYESVITNNEGPKLIVLFETYDEITKVSKRVQSIQGKDVKPTGRQRRHGAAADPLPNSNDSEQVKESAMSGRKMTCRPENLVKYSVGSFEIQVYKASICDLSVDCIVNAANDRLSHGAGVARAIADRAGDDLTKDGNKYIRSKGPIPVGDVAVTTAGLLPYRCVIHAVGPNWSDYDTNTPDGVQQCGKDLYQAVLNSFSMANAKGMKSVAIPAISSAIFGVPIKYCTMMYARAVLDFRTLNKNDTCLREIHFVDVNEKTVEEIQNMFNCMIRELKPEPYQPSDFLPKSHSRRRHGEYMPMDTSSTPKNQQQTFSASMRENEHHKLIAPLIHEKENKSQGVIIHKFQSLELGQNIICYMGDILDAKVDSLVVIIDTTGGPGQICRGLKVRMDVSKVGMYESNLKGEISKNSYIGSVFETGGYGTQFKNILHVVLPLTVKSKSPKERCEMMKGTYQILYQKVCNNAMTRSVAMTLLAVDTDKSDDITLGAEMFWSGFLAYCENVQRKEKETRNLLDVYLVCNTNYTLSKTIDLLGKKNELLAQDVKKIPAGNVGNDITQEELKNQDTCVICMEKINEPKKLVCGHIFCRDCIDLSLSFKQTCPTCQCVCGKITGDQPPGKMTVKQIHGFCTGYETVGKIRINYDFFGGRQLETHPSPGKMYEGISRTAYLPDNEQGRNICKMLKVAFERKLVFTIGDSRTTGHDGVITWNDIHHKTDYRAYSQFGYPDPTYLERVTDELKAKGVTLDDINPTDKLEGIITTD
ncbi:hypothetical protein DPMN_165116 [Dreissena polymorpha]|uniref:E3 ubiquitin-protein ligase n=1 Tax=Dreissena polymorpha TaxID=45954 RepID=A0A9D4IW95_DREPO|nr:hypothetical protein DPMN_165116 [Dreissena polymorpha]